MIVGKKTSSSLVLLGGIILSLVILYFQVYVPWKQKDEVLAGKNCVGVNIIELKTIDGRTVLLKTAELSAHISMCIVNEGKIE